MIYKRSTALERLVKNILLEGFVAMLYVQVNNTSVLFVSGYALRWR